MHVKSVSHLNTSNSEDLFSLSLSSQGPLNSIALLVTTASDVAKWLQFNLRHGRLQDGRQLIRPDVWSAMWMEQAKLSPLFLAGVDKSDNRWPVKDYSVGYGLFWFINKYRGGWWLCLCASGCNNNDVLVYVLFLQTGAHKPITKPRTKP